VAAIEANQAGGTGTTALLRPLLSLPRGLMSLPRGARPFVAAVTVLYLAAIVVGVLTTRVTAADANAFASLVCAALLSIEGSL